MRKMIQFERFKNLILSTDQRAIFDNLAGPCQFPDVMMQEEELKSFKLGT